MRAPSVLEPREPAGEDAFELSRIIRIEFVEQSALVAHVRRKRFVYEPAPSDGESNNTPSTVIGGCPHRNQTVALEPIDPLADRPRGHHGVPRQLTRSALERLPRPAQSGENIELALTESELAVHSRELIREVGRQTVQSPDHGLRRYVKIGPLAPPLCLDARDSI